jgi:predicted enzyme related to lactoylglutathione lyase
MPPATNPGYMIYVMVDNIEASCELVVANGGEIVQPVDPAAREITAHFRDPAGNVLGLYQQSGRRES